MSTVEGGIITRGNEECMGPDFGWHSVRSLEEGYFHSTQAIKVVWEFEGDKKMFVVPAEFEPNKGKRIKLGRQIPIHEYVEKYQLTDFDRSQRRENIEVEEVSRFIKTFTSLPSRA